MNTNNQKTRSKIANEIFHDIPPSHKRRKMTAEDLAILLAKYKSDTPVHILLEHELNLRIVKEQNRITLTTGLIAAGVAIFIFILGMVLKCTP